MEYSLEAAPDQGVVTLTIEQAGTEVVREARHEPAPLARGHVPAHRNAIARIEAGIDGDGRPFAGGFMVMLRCPPGDF